MWVHYIQVLNTNGAFFMTIAYDLIRNRIDELTEVEWADAPTGWQAYQLGTNLVLVNREAEESRTVADFEAAKDAIAGYGNRVESPVAEEPTTATTTRTRRKPASAVEERGTRRKRTAKEPDAVNDPVEAVSDPVAAIEPVTAIAPVAASDLVAAIEALRAELTMSVLALRKDISSVRDRLSAVETGTMVLTASVSEGLTAIQAGHGFVTETLRDLVVTLQSIVVEAAEEAEEQAVEGLSINPLGYDDEVEELVVEEVEEPVVEEPVGNPPLPAIVGSTVYLSLISSDPDADAANNVLCDLEDAGIALGEMAEKQSGVYWVLECGADEQLATAIANFLKA
jgi:hypothetical protein